MSTVLEDAKERVLLLNRARDFHSLLDHPGWKHVYALQTEWVEKARLQLRGVDTSDHAKAIDALQRWQIAENLVELEARFINETLEHAKEISGSLTLEDALLMEQFGHEQTTTDPTRTDPTGH